MVDWRHRVDHDYKADEVRAVIPVARDLIARLVQNPSAVHPPTGRLLPFAEQRRWSDIGCAPFYGNTTSHALKFRGEIHITLSTFLRDSQAIESSV
jgi:hypothetical protein